MNNPEVLLRQIAEYDHRQLSVNETLKKFEEFRVWAGRIFAEHKSIAFTPREIDILSLALHEYEDGEYLLSLGYSEKEYADLVKKI